MNSATFMRIIEKKSTESFSGLPYAIALFNCLIYTFYGSPLIRLLWLSMAFAFFFSVASFVSISVSLHQNLWYYLVLLPQFLPLPLKLFLPLPLPWLMDDCAANAPSSDVCDLLILCS